MFDNKRLNVIAVDIYLQNKAKGFWDAERNVGEMLMLVTSELAEALEFHRKGKFVEGDQWKDTFEEEIADAFIRLFDLCGGLDIDIAKMIQLKLEYNKQRPYKHGKKY